MPKRTNHLRLYCKRAGITQTELARQIGVSPEWLSRIAHGKAEFSEKIERRIVRTLNLTNDEANDAFRFPGAHLYRKEASDRSSLIDFPEARNRRT
jgi:transcriptional regulator with XRE-family HTH domain